VRAELRPVRYRPRRRVRTYREQAQVRPGWSVALILTKRLRQGRYAEFVFAGLITAASAQATTRAWYSGLTSWLANAGQIAAALVAAGAIAAFIWGTYRKTVGRRRDRYGRLIRLGTNAQVSFFSSVLGEPPAIRKTQEGTVSVYDDTGKQSRKQKIWTECIWIDRDFYVQAYADKDETIHAYSVTTRSRHFNPRFRPPGGHGIEPSRMQRVLRMPAIKLQPQIKLGKSHFEVLGYPQQAAAWMGAHNLLYFESYYLGNPGYYQTFVFSINDAGYRPYERWDQRLQNFSIGFTSDGRRAWPEENDLQLPSWYTTFRRHARINTYTVMTLALTDYPAFSSPPEAFPTSFGPSSGITRTIVSASMRRYWITQWWREIIDGWTRKQNHDNRTAKPRQRAH